MLVGKLWRSVLVCLSPSCVLILANSWTPWLAVSFVREGSTDHDRPSFSARRWDSDGNRNENNGGVFSW